MKREMEEALKSRQVEARLAALKTMTQSFSTFGQMMQQLASAMDTEAGYK